MFNSEIHRSERFRRLFKEAFWIVFGQAMAVVGSLVGVRVLTGLLAPAEYGELALGMTIASLVNQTVFGPLGNGVTRFFAPAQEQGNFGAYLNTVRQLVLLATGIIFLIILFTYVGLQIICRTEWIGIAIVALIFSILSGYNSILSGIQNAARQRSVAALHQGIEPWARFLVATSLLLWLGATSTVVMVGYVLALILVFGSQYIFILKIASKKVNIAVTLKNWQQHILKYSWPFATWGIFYWAQSSSDRWALGLFATTNEVGMYAVLFQLGYYPMSLATGMAMQFLAPILYQRAGDGSDNQRNTNINSLCWRLTWLTLGVTGNIFFVVYLFHTQIFRYFVGKEYASVSYLLPWMFLAGGIFAVGQTISLSQMSKTETHIMMPCKIITALMGVLFNFVGAYFFGVAGIVFAGVLFSIIYSLWMMLLSKKLQSVIV